MSAQTTPEWGVCFTFSASPELVKLISFAVDSVSRDISCFDELRNYHSLVWTVRRRPEPGHPGEYIGLEVVISVNGQDSYGFGLPLQIDRLTALHRIADEFQNLVLDEHIQWPIVDGNMLTANTIGNQVVWNKKGAQVANIGHLCDPGT